MRTKDFNTEALSAGKHQCNVSRASLSCIICKKMLWRLRKTEKFPLSSTVQENLRSYTELHTKLLLSNSSVRLGDRFKLLHVLRKQLLTPNDTTPNGKHKFGKSSPAGKASTQTISHQKLTWIPGHSSSIRALNSSGWIWGCTASKLHWGGETVEPGCCHACTKHCSLWLGHQRKACRDHSELSQPR